MCEEGIHPTPEIERALEGINLELQELGIEASVIWMDIRGGDALHTLADPGQKNCSPQTYLMRNMERIQEVVDAHLAKHGAKLRKPAWLQKKIAVAKEKMGAHTRTWDLSDVTFEVVANPPSSAVRALHKPTGIQVVCSKHILPMQNQIEALKELQEKVAEAEMGESHDG